MDLKKYLYLCIKSQYDHYQHHCIMNKEITFDRFIRGLIAIIGCAILYLLVDRLSGVLLPFLIAWLFCYLVYPTVKFFQ